MAVHQPFYLNENYDRIKTLKRARCSDGTIASVINDQCNTNLSAADVTGYIAISNIAAKKMLVANDTLAAITEGAPADVASIEEAEEVSHIEMAEEDEFTA